MKKSLKEIKFVFKCQISVEECLDRSNYGSKNTVKDLQAIFKK